MTRPASPIVWSLDPEKVAYWYFRLNGFFQIENFVVHPARRGGRRRPARNPREGVMGNGAARTGMLGLLPAERAVAAVEGWILGVGGSLRDPANQFEEAGLARP
jgi:hypothetical protein